MALQLIQTAPIDVALEISTPLLRDPVHSASCCTALLERLQTQVTDTESECKMLMRHLVLNCVPSSKVTQQIIELLPVINWPEILIESIPAIVHGEGDEIVLVLESLQEAVTCNRALILPVVGALADLPLSNVHKERVYAFVVECIVVVEESDVPTLLRTLIHSLHQDNIKEGISTIREECCRLNSSSELLCVEILVNAAIMDPVLLDNLLESFMETNVLSHFDIVLLALFMHRYNDEKKLHKCLFKAIANNAFEELSIATAISRVVSMQENSEISSIEMGFVKMALFFLPNAQINLITPLFCQLFNAFPKWQRYILTQLTDTAAKFGHLTHLSLLKYTNTDLSPKEVVSRCVFLIEHITRMYSTSVVQHTSVFQDFLPHLSILSNEAHKVFARAIIVCASLKSSFLDWLILYVRKGFTNIADYQSARVVLHIALTMVHENHINNLPLSSIEIVMGALLKVFILLNKQLQLIALKEFVAHLDKIPDKLFDRIFYATVLPLMKYYRLKGGDIEQEWVSLSNMDEYIYFRSTSSQDIEYKDNKEEEEEEEEEGKESELSKEKCKPLSLSFDQRANLDLFSEVNSETTLYNDFGLRLDVAISHFYKKLAISYDITNIRNISSQEILHNIEFISLLWVMYSAKKSKQNTPLRSLPCSLSWGITLFQPLACFRKWSSLHMTSANLILSMWIWKEAIERRRWQNKQAFAAKSCALNLDDKPINYLENSPQMIEISKKLCNLLSYSLSQLPSTKEIDLQCTTYLSAMHVLCKSLEYPEASNASTNRIESNQSAIVANCFSCSSHNAGSVNQEFALTLLEYSVLLELQIYPPIAVLICGYYQHHKMLKIQDFSQEKVSHDSHSSHGVDAISSNRGEELKVVELQTKVDNIDAGWNPLDPIVAKRRNLKLGRMLGGPDDSQPKKKLKRKRPTKVIPQKSTQMSTSQMSTSESKFSQKSFKFPLSPLASAHVHTFYNLPTIPIVYTCAALTPLVASIQQFCVDVDIIDGRSKSHTKECLRCISKSMESKLVVLFFAMRNVAQKFLQEETAETSALPKQFASRPNCFSEPSVTGNSHPKSDGLQQTTLVLCTNAIAPISRLLCLMLKILGFLRKEQNWPIKGSENCEICNSMDKERQSKLNIHDCQLPESKKPKRRIQPILIDKASINTETHMESNVEDSKKDLVEYATMVDLCSYLVSVSSRILTVVILQTRPDISGDISLVSTIPISESTPVAWVSWIKLLIQLCNGLTLSEQIQCCMESDWKIHENVVIDQGKAMLGALLERIYISLERLVHKLNDGGAALQLLTLMLSLTYGMKKAKRLALLAFQAIISPFAWCHPISGSIIVDLPLKRQLSVLPAEITSILISLNSKFGFMALEGCIRVFRESSRISCQSKLLESFNPTSVSNFALRRIMTTCLASASVDQTLNMLVYILHACRSLIARVQNTHGAFQENLSSSRVVCRTLTAETLDTYLLFTRTLSHICLIRSLPCASNDSQSFESTVLNESFPVSYKELFHIIDRKTHHRPYYLVERSLLISSAVVELHFQMAIHDFIEEQSTNIFKIIRDCKTWVGYIEKKISCCFDWRASDLGDPETQDVENLRTLFASAYIFVYNTKRLLHWGWSQKMFSTNLETHQKPNKQKAIKLSRILSLLDFQLVQLESYLESSTQAYLYDWIVPHWNFSNDEQVDDWEGCSGDLTWEFMPIEYPLDFQELGSQRDEGAEGATHSQTQPSETSEAPGWCAEIFTREPTFHFVEENEIFDQDDTEFDTIPNHRHTTKLQNKGFYGELR